MSYYTERADYFKSTHRCVRCGKKDESTENGSKLCPDCREYFKFARKKYYVNNKDKVRQLQRDRIARLKAEGLCVVCGKEKAIDGQTKCDRCRKKNNSHTSHYYAKKVKANG